MKRPDFALDGLAPVPTVPGYLERESAGAGLTRQFGPLRGETIVLTSFIKAFTQRRADHRCSEAVRHAGIREHVAHGFTLIELLIVVAIISILASIAVPNFLEAQTRARVAAMRNDMRVLATGLESYRVDSNAYPPRSVFPDSKVLSRAADATERVRELGRITSPIAYLTSIPRDLFETVLAPPNNRIDYWPYTVSDPVLANVPTLLEGIRSRGGEWALMSVGPDGTVGFNRGGTSATIWGHFPPTYDPFVLTYRNEYDPSNGTISGGNLYRFQSGRDGTEVYSFN